ncbi:hypothetical protein DUNSADRAFT_13808 [Dunaliella salina]|uniref:Uncharacterized protein n=1 Tax=Dunaliella salina TaxID=3046 RepID=A0ABQ7G8M8_DUNSA|nr:hypothetical protein DUNSADRAFT_13808 [Dunaliella salina]|eukprot:KAF5830951.1 hypothetical protein DUNSADRAFT_13808 [Dunaliella salina]
MYHAKELRVFAQIIAWEKVVIFSPACRHTCSNKVDALTPHRQGNLPLLLNFWRQPTWHGFLSPELHRYWLRQSTAPV